MPIFRNSGESAASIAVVLRARGSHDERSVTHFTRPIPPFTEPPPGRVGRPRDRPADPARRHHAGDSFGSARRWRVGRRRLERVRRDHLGGRHHEAGPGGLPVDRVRRRRGLRRRGRHRRPLPPVPAARPRAPRGIRRGCRSGGRPQGAGDLRAGTAGRDRRPLRGIAGADPRRSGQDQGHRLRRAGRGHRDRLPRRRRPQRTRHLRQGTWPRGLATHAAGLPADGRALAGWREAADAAQRRPIRRTRTAAGTDLPALHASTSPKSRHWGRNLDRTHGRADQHGAVLLRERVPPVQRRTGGAGDRAAARHRGHRPDVRRRQHEPGRCTDIGLAREALLRLLAADHRDPTGRHRRQPGRPSPTRTGRR